MQALQRPWGAMHIRVDGAAEGPTVVFANSLGTDLRLWDALLPHVPAGLRVLRFDKRGHGLSDRGGPVTDEGFADDVVALIAAEARGPVVMVGLSIGGLIAQAVASRGLLRAVVLSNTAAKLGTAESWNARIAAVQAGGLAPLAAGVMERWFGPTFRATQAVAPWQNMLARTDPEGYIAACGALAQADRTAATAALRLPTLVIAGSEDGATPPDLVRGTAALIPGAAFHLIPDAGHLPCVEAPETYAALLNPFLKAHLDV